MSPRIYREFKNLEFIDVSKLKNEKVALKIQFRRIERDCFNDIEGNLHTKQFSKTRFLTTEMLLAFSLLPY